MDETEGHQAKERPDGVNKKRLADLDLEIKIPIYHKTSPRSANTQLFTSFPKEALTLFSKAALTASRKLQDQNEKFSLFQIRGGDMAALKSIFNWIKDCLDQQTITKFPDLPESDANPFGPTLKVIQAANLLEIPAGSLQFFLEKRLDFIARKNLISSDQVREFYTANSELHKAGLQHIACNSIFNAWWDFRLDASVNPDLMCQLTDLRTELPELDADLHRACKNKEAEVAQRAQERKLARERGAGQLTFDNNDFGTDGNDNVQGWENNTTVAATGDWLDPNGGNGGGPSWTTTDAGDDWDKENIVTSGTGHEDNTGPEDNNTVNGNGNGNESQPLDWADESAAEYQQKSHLQSFAGLPTGSW